MYRASCKDGIAWVTGASAGVGKEVVKLLLKEGYKVAVTARNIDSLLDLKQLDPDNILVYPGDITDKKSIQDLLQKIEHDYDVVLAFLNAGGFERSIQRTMQLNFTGTLNCIESLRKYMIGRKKGHIVIMSSISGVVALPKFDCGYIISKSALIKLAELTKLKFEQSNIRVQLCTPSFIDTGLIAPEIYNMPFLVDVNTAAKKIVNGIKYGGFEISFPKITVYWLKLISILPYSLYFALLKVTMFFIKK